MYRANIDPTDMKDMNAIHISYIGYFITKCHWLYFISLMPLGVPHNGDLPYVFGYSLLRKNEFLREEAEMYYDVIDFDEEDDKYTEYILELWANFAKTG